jgi:drug/metabolite transporter (DMT)-like permease
MSASRVTLTRPRRHTGFVALVLSIAFQTGSIAFGKIAAVSMVHFRPADVLANGFYFLSLACLGLQAITWQIALARYPLSYAYAAMSVVYVNVLLLSAFALHETITPANAIGSLLIISGVTMLSAGGRTRSHV